MALGGDDPNQDCAPEGDGLMSGASGGAELRLAMALATFLQVRCPAGVAFGALAGPEVRQSLKDCMRDAGIRSFKAKWLQRFPEQLIFDSRTKSIRAAPTMIVAAAIGQEAEEADATARQEHLETDGSSKCPSSAPPQERHRRSCLKGSRSFECQEGAAGMQRPQLLFADRTDELLFKVGHEPRFVVQKSQQLQRPMKLGHDDEMTGRHVYRKADKEVWLSASLLPPLSDDHDDE